jgi:hypothetical protein
VRGLCAARDGDAPSSGNAAGGGETLDRAYAPRHLPHVKRAEVRHAGRGRNLRVGPEIREEYFRVWQNWTKWAVSHPERRSALAQLSVSDELTPETRLSGHKTMAPMVDLLRRVVANGPLSKTPVSFVVALMNATAEATIEAMSHDSTQHPIAFSIGSKSVPESSQAANYKG